MQLLKQYRIHLHIKSKLDRAIELSHIVWRRHSLQPVMDLKWQGKTDNAAFEHAGLLSRQARLDDGETNYMERSSPINEGVGFPHLSASHTIASRPFFHATAAAIPLPPYINF